MSQEHHNKVNRWSSELPHTISPLNGSLEPKRLLYKHVSDAGKQFLTLVIPKSWKFTILVEAHNKLGHQGNNHMYCLIKCQYYWKGMKKDIRKYIANCVLCR